MIGMGSVPVSFACTLKKAKKISTLFKVEQEEVSSMKVEPKMIASTKKTVTNTGMLIISIISSCLTFETEFTHSLPRLKLPSTTNC